MRKDSRKWYPLKGLELLSSDSLGVRSFCIFIDAGNVKIIIDPGLDIAPLRYDLPPHPKEIDRFFKLKEKIVHKLKIADIVIVSHFHHDHFTKELVPLFKGKKVFIKDPEKNINYMQRKRSTEITGIVKDFSIADGRVYEIEAVKMFFSKPFPHGRTPAVVVSTFVQTEKFSILHTSDISGPIEDKPLQFILDMKPDVLILDGPALYINRRDKEVFLRNIRHIREKIPETKIVIDHHTTRDLNWRDDLNEITDFAITFAEYNGLEDQPLEGMRKKLWCRDDLSEDFFKSPNAEGEEKYRKY